MTYKNRDIVTKYARQKGGENKIKNIQTMLLFGTSLVLVMILGSVSLGFAQENSAIFYRSSVLDDYKFYDENGEARFYVGFRTMGLFEQKYYDPVTNTINNNITQTQSDFGGSVEIPNMDDRISKNTQEDVFFIKTYLAQTMTAEELEQTFYDFTVTFDGKADHSQFPDYVQVLSTSEALREAVEEFPDGVATDLKASIPNDERIRLLAPITKLYDLLDLGEVKTITDDRNEILGKITPASNQSKKHFEGVKYNFEKYQSPKTQIENGLLSSLVQCNDGLELAKKYDGLPVCVKDDSLEKLEQRNYLSKVG